MGGGATCFGRIRFVNPVQTYPAPGSFLAEVADELAMWPLTDLLVSGCTQADARLNVAHIPHRQMRDPFLRAEAYHLLRGLMQDVALLAIKFGAPLRLTALEALRTAGTGLAATQLLLQDGV